MLTKETIKGMKKKDLVALAIADQNRLEYLQDKVQRLDFENRKYKNGLEELQTATEVLLMKVTAEKGSDVNGRRELWIQRHMDVSGYDVETQLDEAGGRIGIILRKK